MSEDAQSEWLPPQAPGADPPRRWESMPELPEAPPAPPAPQGITAPPSAATEWWHGGAQAQPQPPPPGYAPVAPPVARSAGNGAAIASLILGVAGLVMFFVAGFGLLFILNLPCSILAWVLGVQAKRKLARGETTEHAGMAQAGLVLGIVGTVLGGLAIIAWALGFIFSEELRDEFQREWDKQQANQ